MLLLRVLKIAIVTAIMIAISLPIWGCISTKGEADAGFRQCTSWSFYHETKKNTEGKDEASISVDIPPSVIEWLLGSPTPDEPEPNGDGE